MTTKVKVAARVRPFIQGEVPDDTVTVSPAEGTVSVANWRPGSNDRFKFSFTSCYGQTATQEELFEKEVEPLLEDVLGGMVYVFAFLSI
jgi:kinesin family member 22